MNITVSKIKRTLVKDYGYTIHTEDMDELIKDVLKIIDNELKTYKGISIKNK